MPVESVTPSPFTVTPANVRYSVLINRKPDFTTVMIDLVRSQRTPVDPNNPDGLARWVDDSRVNVPGVKNPRQSLRGVQSNAAIMAALNPLLAAVEQNAALFGLEAFPTTYRLHIASFIGAESIGDVRVVLMRDGEPVKSIPSLNTLLATMASQNPATASAIGQLWSAMDAAVSAQNAEKEWV